MVNILEFTTDVKNTMYKGKITLIAFLDASATYDNIKRNVLVDKLQREECSNKFLRFINHWMDMRKIEYIIGDKESEERTVVQELP